jgi:hypothetical protein
LLERLIEWQIRNRALLESRPAGVLDDPRLTGVRTELGELFEGAVVAAQRSGELREDVGSQDFLVLGLAVAQIGAELDSMAPGRWRRYLAIVLDGLRPGGAPLTTEEIS